MTYKLKYKLSLGAGQALLEQSQYINDWALEFADYLAKDRAKITGYEPCIIRDDIEMATGIVKKNREIVEKANAEGGDQ